MPLSLSSCGIWLLLVIMLIMPQSFNSLRCYVCGGNSGTPCNSEKVDQGGMIGIADPVQECNDLINNRGCVKQFVNGVVLLRGCWLDGTNKCLRNGAAEVCTCSKDLCNSSSAAKSSYLLLLLPLLLTAFSVYAQSIPAISLPQQDGACLGARSRHKSPLPSKSSPTEGRIYRHRTNKKRSIIRRNGEDNNNPIVVSWQNSSLQRC